MAFLIGGANSLTGGYDIDNSVRFAGGGELTFTPGSDGDKTTFTISCWVKKCENAGERQVIFGAQGGADYLRWGDGEEIHFQVADASATRSYVTGAKFRDPSAWYHIVAIWDTSDGTNANRMQVYVNGVFATPGTQPTIAQDAVSTHFNDSSQVHHIAGEVNPANDFHFEGYMSEFYFIDGTAYAATDFGKTNDDGVWIPKDAKGNLTFGDNGCYLEFKGTGTDADASGIGADTSGEDNHFAVASVAAVDVTVDTPTNNFATLNPLNTLNGTLSEGNTQFVRASDATAGTVSTICPSNGKWYMEFQNSAAQNSAIGVVNVDVHPAGTNIYPYTYAAAILLETSLINTHTYAQVASSGGTNRDTTTNVGTTKIGMAVDLDNQDIYVSTGGQWWGGSSFNQGTGPGTALITDLPTTGFAAGFYINGSIVNACYYNFGNPGGADSISSSNADANGHGNFEYAVPSGYFALCTKNLAENG